MNTNEPQPLARMESGALARPSAAPDIGVMMQAIIDRGVTGENVAAMEQLCKLYEHMEDRNAEKAFAAAFVELQSEMGSVKASRPVPNNDGTTRYRFAPFEDIMAEVGPRLKQHGFAVTFSTDFKEGRLIKSCTLQHVSGHSKTNSFAVRIGSGPPKATESQADGAASTYAKRFALCDALNIQIDHDTDAAAEGGSVTPAQAEELERRVKLTNTDVAKFLAYAGAKTFAEIKATRYAELDANLARKEGGR